jgi:hypothetical protein
MVAASTTCVAVSVGTRQWRQRHIEELPLASEALFNDSKRKTSVEELVCTMTRAKLMGTKKSVNHELQDIRKWHVEHGYKGGLVLRELQKPVFGSTQEDTPEFEFMDAMALARRECYYIYYEIKGDGEIRQQIFCRGTTLGVDILTCLQFWWVYDEDLGCRVHRGFRNHANHLLRDILPLLLSDKRATIEISGHSLGGAAAFLLAIKLRLLGYNVVKLTTVAAPRFCNASGVPILSRYLPPDTLRIEDDRDIVPFLPPFGRHLGDLVWLVDKGPARYVPFSPIYSWTDSAFVNFRMWEVLSSFSKHHRVMSHARRLEKSANEQSTSDRLAPSASS